MARETKKELTIGDLKVEIEKDSSGHYVAHSPDVEIEVGGTRVRPTVGAKVERMDNGGEELSVVIGIRVPIC